jgi:recombinational DNA repair protein (RecF pathway)
MSDDGVSNAFPLDFPITFEADVTPEEASLLRELLEELGRQSTNDVINEAAREIMAELFQHVQENPNRIKDVSEAFVEMLDMIK